MMEHRADISGDLLLHDGEIFKGTDQVGKLCRKLKEGILRVYRAENLAMTVNVESRAEKSLSETDKGGLRYGKYAPFPEFLKD